MDIFKEEEQKSEFSQCMDAINALNESMQKGFSQLNTAPRKKRRIGFLIGAIFFFIYGAMFSIGIIGVALSNVGDNDLTLDNTEELNVTIEKIQVIPYLITTKEYNATFFVSSGYIVDDMDALSKLKAGDSITIRINKSDKKRLTDLSNKIELCHLNFASNQIISLQSYNDYYSQSNSIGAVIAFSVIAALLLSGGAIFLYFYKRTNRQTPKKIKTKYANNYLK